jgi:hypothetical protein
MFFIRKSFNRLKKARLTGEITPREEELLRLHLADSAEKHRDLSRLLELEEQLNTNQPAEEEVNLSHQIMRTIRSSPQKKKTYFTDPALLFNLSIPFPLQYAALLLIGLVIGATATWVILPSKNSVPESMITGTMSANTLTGMSYHKDNTTLKMVPLQIANIHYLNFMVNSRDEIELELLYNEQDFTVIQSEYINSPGHSGFSLENGSVTFSASGSTQIQVVLEKTSDQPARITLTGRQNHAVITTKQLFLP